MGADPFNVMFFRILLKNSFKYVKIFLSEYRKEKKTFMASFVGRSSKLFPFHSNLLLLSGTYCENDVRQSAL